MRPSPTIDQLKLCRPCSTWKMMTEFSKDARIKSGLSARCKSCNRGNAKKHRIANPGLHAKQVAAWREINPQYGRDYYEANIERIRKAGVSSNRRRRYGLSDDDYMYMWNRQDGLCYLCKKPETTKYNDGRIKMLSVDHCHSSGKVRKLLCHYCNTGFGMFKDDPELLQLAIDYLKEH